jgi:hypothetical protein
MWTFDEGHVHTYIVSNHTRATNAIAGTLLDDVRMKPIIADTLVNGRIPERFQIAFKVSLSHDKQASSPSLLQTITY